MRPILLRQHAVGGRPTGQPGSCNLWLLGSWRSWFRRRSRAILEQIDRYHLVSRVVMGLTTGGVKSRVPECPSLPSRRVNSGRGWSLPSATRSASAPFLAPSNTFSERLRPKFFSSLLSNEIVEPLHVHQFPILHVHSHYPLHRRQSLAFWSTTHADTKRLYAVLLREASRA